MQAARKARYGPGDSQDAHAMGGFGGQESSDMTRRAMASIIPRDKDEPSRSAGSPGARSGSYSISLTSCSMTPFEYPAEEEPAAWP